MHELCGSPGKRMVASAKQPEELRQSERTQHLVTERRPGFPSGFLNQPCLACRPTVVVHDARRERPTALVAQQDGSGGGTDCHSGYLPALQAGDGLARSLADGAPPLLGILLVRCGDSPNPGQATRRGTREPPLSIGQRHLHALRAEINARRERATCGFAVDNPMLHCGGSANSGKRDLFTNTDRREVFDHREVVASV